MAYMEEFNPDYVLILGGDHIYKMDYEVMLDYHKANKADVTLACMPVPWEEASRFGLAITDESGRVTDFEEKPEHPKSNLASMGIYIFSWPVLKEALLALKDQPDVTLANISFRTARKKASASLPMSTTDTGKMSEHWVLLGSQYGADRYHS